MTVHFPKSHPFVRGFKVAKGIVIFHALRPYSISNESIYSLGFSCGHDLRDAL